VTNPDCAVCMTVAEPVDSSMDDMWAFRPNTSEIPGHIIVAMRVHVVDAYVSPPLSGKLFAYACMVAKRQGLRSANILACIGEAADQTVQHLYYHIIPRTPGDDILLPWDKEEGNAKGKGHDRSSPAKTARDNGNSTRRRPSPTVRKDNESG